MQVMVFIPDALTFWFDGPVSEILLIVSVVFFTAIKRI